MATTAITKTLDEAYAYAKRIEALSNAYAGYGDYFDLRVTGASTVKVRAGSETDDSAASDVIFVISLNGVRSGITITLNDETTPDTVSFSSGDPAGKCKKVTLAGALDSGANIAVATGNAGDRFLIMKDPDVDSTNDTELIYIQSKSETPVGENERPYYDKNIMRGIKKIVQAEPSSISVSQHFQAYDKGLLAYKGHRFNMLVERDDDNAGTITEQEYYFDCFFAVGGPNESGGDTDTDFSLDIQYLFKGVVVGDA